MRHIDLNKSLIESAMEHLGGKPSAPKAVEEEMNIIITEGVTVEKGKRHGVITVRDGNNDTFPLHPEHQNKIRALQKDQKTSFKDETGRNVTAHRTGSLVHLKGDGSNRTIAVAHKHFSEEEIGRAHV